MSDDSSEELLTGRESNEAAQGWGQMVSADPVSNPDDIPTDGIMTESELERARRPVEADWGEFTEREYFNNATGEPTPERQSVSPEQAGKDLANVRGQERQAREDQAAQDLRSALDQTGQPQQPAQDQQPQPELEQPQLDGVQPEMTAEQAQALYEQADKELETALQNPLLREKLETEFNAVRAESKQEVERAYNLSAAVQQHYATATNNLVAEAGGIIGALYPELNGLSGERLQGALAIMQQTNPQRVQALQQLASRAQGLVQAQQRQQYEAQQGHAMQQQHELEKFSAAEEKRYEEAVKHESAETMRAVRENVYPTVEKAYGIPKETMQRLYSGEQRVDSAAFVRSAAFQLMLTDAVKYRLSKQGITQARSNPIPKVQRPGVASDGPKVYDGDLSAAASRFNLPGGNEGTQGLKNAAAWITARRGGR